MTQEYQPTRLTGLKLRIFARLFPLLALLVIAICAASLVFAIFHHRQDMKALFSDVAKIHAKEFAILIHKNDFNTIKDRLKALCSHKLIKSAFIEKKGQIFIKVPYNDSPLASNSHKEDFSSKGKAVIKTVKDSNGSVFYDIASKIPNTGATLHLLLSCDAIDQHVFSTFLTVIFLGMGTIVLVGAMSFLFSNWATKEVDSLTKVLDEERKQLLSIFDSISEIIYVIDPETYEILYCNRALKESFKKDLVGKCCYKELQGRDSPCECCNKDFLLKEDGIYRWECYNQILDQYFWITDRIIKWPDGRLVRFELAINITERKKAEEKLKESEERYRTLFDASSDAVYLETIEGEIIDCNEAACKMLGYDRDELIGLNVADIVPDDVKTELANVALEIVSKGKICIESFGKRKDGSIFPTEVNARLIKIGNRHMVIVYVRDISAQKEIEKEKAKLQEQLRQAQKMEAIGTLAGGIAHDFNNLLTVINGHSEIALMKVGDNLALKNDIKMIKEAGERAAQLISQLLAFSRKQIYEPKTVSVNQIIMDLDRMLSRLISEDIYIEKRLCDNLPPIMADPTQIEQILINLIVNARDAIYERQDNKVEKKITIETSYVFLDDSYVKKHLGSKKGPHVLICVSDTGVGMDEETQKRIFEPFFSTKEMGRGTGLGLATIYGIVKQNNACIYVYSEPGKGSSFKIYWPVSKDKEVAIQEDDYEEIPGGNEHILVVEDNEFVRGLIYDALTQAGYKVFKASNGEEALSLIEKDGLIPQLIISDLIMPGMNGKELINKIEKVLPNIAVLYISGYTDNYIVHNGILEKGTNFIQKPFTINKLLKKVRSILDE